MIAAAWMVGALALAAGDPAPALPAAVLAEYPRLEAYSEARFRKWAWHVYDATLWIEGARWQPEGVFALELRYAMAIRGRDLAQRTLDEMRKQGRGDAAQLERWRHALERLFPDIAPGDRLVGVSLSGRETRFFDGARLLGAIRDPEFTAAFFAIWLGEGTSEPALRRRLLKLPG